MKDTLKERDWIANFAKEISTSVRYFCGKGQYEENTLEQKAYLDGVETAIGMMYIDLIETPKNKGKLSTLIEQTRKEEQDRIVEMIEENLPNEYKFSYDSSIDITEIPDEVWQELETMKKSIKGTKEFVINLIK